MSVPCKKSVRSAPAPIQARMLNVKQAAEYLGATVSFVRHEEWAKRLPSVTFGKRLMVDQRYLDQYIEAAKVPA